MLYDVYKVSHGVYRYVGPYDAGDLACHSLRQRLRTYVTTVNNLSEASLAATDDHIESNAGGGMVSRQLTVDEAVEIFDTAVPSRATQPEAR